MTNEFWLSKKYAEVVTASKHRDFNCDDKGLRVYCDMIGSLTIQIRGKRANTAAFATVRLDIAELKELRAYITQAIDEVESSASVS